MEPAAENMIKRCIKICRGVVDEYPSKIFAMYMLNIIRNLMEKVSTTKLHSFTPN